MSHTGVLVKQLLDEAFRVLRPDSPEDDPSEPHLRSALGKAFWAILESLVLAEPVKGTPVNFWGMNPLEIGKGASLPMIPDSWRYGFRKTAEGLDFSAQDAGPLVAWEAVKDAVAAANVAQGAEADTQSHLTSSAVKSNDRQIAPTAQIGTSDEADFERGTWTFRMRPGFIVTAGEYLIVQKRQPAEGGDADPL